MAYQITAACGCDIGRRRSNNEDNFYFNGRFLPAENRALEEILIQNTTLNRAIDFGVFDGMGGQADGQIASNIAASVFMDVQKKFDPDDEPEVFLKYAVQKMTDAVWNQADELFSNMGTTAAILHFTPDKYYICNVGDSRVFQFRHGLLRQISKDHTDEDFLSAHAVSSRKPSLTQYIGVSPEELTVVPYLSSGELAAQDDYLICSDGLTDMVEPDTISGILSSKNTTVEKAEILIQEALRAGGRDNITVILIHVEEERQATLSGNTSNKRNLSPKRETTVLEELTASLSDNELVQNEEFNDSEADMEGRNIQQENLNVLSSVAPVMSAKTELPGSGEEYEKHGFLGFGVVAIFVIGLMLIILCAIFALKFSSQNKKKADVSNLPVSSSESSQDATDDTSHTTADVADDISYTTEDGKYYCLEEKTKSGLTVKSIFDAQTKERVSTIVYDNTGEVLLSNEKGNQDDEDTQAEGVPDQQNSSNPDSGRENSVSDYERTESDSAALSEQTGSNTIVSSAPTITANNQNTTEQTSNSLPE